MPEIDEYIHSLELLAQELEEQHRGGEAYAVYRRIERLQAAKEREGEKS